MQSSSSVPTALSFPTDKFVCIFRRASSKLIFLPENTQIQQIYFLAKHFCQSLLSTELLYRQNSCKCVWNWRSVKFWSKCWRFHDHFLRLCTNLGHCVCRIIKSKRQSSSEEHFHSNLQHKSEIWFNSRFSLDILDQSFRKRLYAIQVYRQ